MYSQDFEFHKDSSVVQKTKDFDWPLQKKSDRFGGGYKLVSDVPIYTCLTSDFFIQEADEWREQVWEIIRKRQDLFFMIITKRIDRFFVSLPSDWGGGYDNVLISCTVENQSRADYLLPIYLSLPMRRRSVSCSPILECIDFSDYLGKDKVDLVVVGGESGKDARVCDFDWVLKIRNQCFEYGVGFCFHQTGAKLKVKNKLYNIPRKFQHLQAKKARINMLSEFDNWLIYG